MNKTPHKPQFQASCSWAGEEFWKKTLRILRMWGRFWALFVPMDPRKKACRKACSLLIVESPGQPQDLEDVVKLSKRLAVNPGLKKGFCCIKFTRGAASQRIHHPRDFKNFYRGKLRSTINFEKTNTATGCVLTVLSPHDAALLFLWYRGNSEKRRKTPGIISIYLVRIDHWES